jgi:hypothetical protein
MIVAVKHEITVMPDHFLDRQPIQAGSTEICNRRMSQIMKMKVFNACLVAKLAEGFVYEPLFLPVLLKYKCVGASGEPLQ